MSSLQLLPTEFSLVQDLNVLPSPSTFFASALPFSGHQPVFATASPPASHDTTYLSDYSASSPANSFTFSSNNHSRSASPATSYNDQPSPKLEPSSLVSAGAHHQHHAHQLHHPAPLAPLALADASAVLSSASSTANFAGLTSAAQHQELKYEVFENYTSAPVSRQQQYQGYEHHAPSQQQGPQQPFYRSVPQMPNSYPSQQQYMQQQQAVQQPQTYYHQVSAPQQQHFAAPDLSFAQQAPAAPQFAPQAAAQQQVFGATPSFETPQGTFYFVPNPNAPVSMGMPMPMPLSLAAAANGAMQQLGQLGQQPPQHARTISTGSWDGDLDDKPRLQPVKKGGKGKKNQTKRFICTHDGCGRAFARNFNLQSHVKSHLGIRDFDCPHCPKKFSRRHDRARHCAAVHDSHLFDARAQSSTSSVQHSPVDDDEEEDYEG